MHARLVFFFFFSLMWIVYLKYCSSLTFLTRNVHWIKLAFSAAFWGSAPDTSTLAAARLRRAPNSASRADSNFPGVPPPRCASQTSDPPGLRLCRAVVRRTYVDATPACGTTPAPPVTHVVFTVTAFSARRAVGPCAGEAEERFRCGSPSARHRSER